MATVRHKIISTKNITNHCRNWWADVFANSVNTALLHCAVLLIVHIHVLQAG